MLSGLVALVSSAGFQIFAWGTLKWVAQRAFLLALALGVGPIVLFKGFSWVTQYMMNYASGKISAEGIQPVMVSFVGIGGWLASTLKLPEAFSIFLSFCLLSFLLRMIRVK